LFAVTVSTFEPPSLEPTGSPAGSSTVRISSFEASAHVMLNLNAASIVSYVFAGTLMVTTCSSTSAAGRAAQLLVGFVPGGIVPVHESVTVPPADVGTVTLLVGGVEPDAVAAASNPVARAMVRNNLRKVMASP